MTDTDDAEMQQEQDPFEGHRIMDVEVTSNLADGATVDVNGTQLFIKQANKHVPVIAEIYVGDESKPIGAFNSAKAETVLLGGVDEGLAERVHEIRELPASEVDKALEELAYRLNPAGRPEP